MNLSDDEKQKLAQLIGTHGTDVQALVLAVYEEGVLAGALRAARAIASKGLSGAVVPPTPQSTPKTGMPEDVRKWLLNKGINPDQRFRIRNSTFTITGISLSRWQYPIDAVTERGTEYKFSVEQVKLHQSR